MKGFIKIAVATVLLSVGFAGSAFAYGEGGNNGKNYQSNATGKTTLAHEGFQEASSSLVKNVKGQNTHTDYQSNTNSCASCHMTHTANSANLLFGNSTQATCIACHDGSLGFYNVKTGELYSPNSTAVTIDPAFTFGTDKVVGSNAGAFDESKQDASMHSVEATKALGVRAAPGGNYYGTTGELGKWGDDFTCASCHAPHGSYSDRLLHYNPNGFASVDIKDRGFGLTKLFSEVGTSAESLGYPVENVNTANLTKANLTATSTYRLVKGTKAELAAKVGNTSHLPATGTIIAVVTWDSTANFYAGGYVVDKTPWVYAPGDSYPYESRYDSFITSAASDTNNSGVITKADDWTATTKYDSTKWTKTVINKYTYDTVHFVYDEGYAYAEGTEFDNVATGRISRASVVNLDLVKVANYTLKDLDLYVTNNGALVGGSLDANGTLEDKGFASSTGVGQNFSKFCATCHVDYLAKSTDAATYQSAASGHYNNFDANNCTDCHAGTVATNTVANTETGKAKFRHTTTSDSFSCARCHLTHGTNATLMKDATGLGYSDIVDKVTNPDTGAKYTSVETLAYLDDVNPSSAIKRYTNMAVCWGCHTNNAAESLVNNKYYEHFNTVPETGNLSWTAGNRVGFGNPISTQVFELKGPSNVYATKSMMVQYSKSVQIKAGLEGTAISISNRGTGADAITGKTVQVITLGSDNYRMAPSKAAVVVYSGITGSGTAAGNMTFDDVSRSITIRLDAPQTIDSTEALFSFTYNSTLYTISIK